VPAPARAGRDLGMWDDMTEPVPRSSRGDCRQVDATLVPRYGGEATFPAAAHRRGDARRCGRARRPLTGVSYRRRRFGPAHIGNRPGCCGLQPALQASPFASQQWRRGGPRGQPVQHRGGDRRHRAGGARPAGTGAVHPDARRRPHGRAADAPGAVGRARPAAVVHFDAPRHLGHYFGAAYTHGTPFRRASRKAARPVGCLHIASAAPVHQQ